jgi:excisionase family DNA binding protein
MEKLLSVDDVADLLGLARCTVYAWASRRRLPALKIGARLMFRPSEIQKWIDGQPRPEGSAARASANSTASLADDLVRDSQFETDTPRHV